MLNWPKCCATCARILLFPISWQAKAEKQKQTRKKLQQKYLKIPRCVGPSGGWLHSSPVIPELGFCLGTRAQMFWLEEGHPAALAPGKRPRTTLSPTLALRDGESYLAWGSPGGDQQDQWIAQMFLRHVHCGMNLQEAIDAPAWHSEHFPSSF
jgi:hypothetical protein